MGDCWRQALSVSGFGNLRREFHGIKNPSPKGRIGCGVRRAQALIDTLERTAFSSTAVRYLYCQKLLESPTTVDPDRF